MEPDWIWQQPDWPSFYWQEAEINLLLREVRVLLGVLIGKSSAIHEIADLNFSLDNMLSNILASSAIEDERLNAQSVRSSLARRLDLGAAAGLLPNTGAMPTWRPGYNALVGMVSGYANRYFRTCADSG